MGASAQDKIAALHALRGCRICGRVAIRDVRGASDDRLILFTMDGELFTARVRNGTLYELTHHPVK